jgi:hypothetical protein
MALAGWLALSLSMLSHQRFLPSYIVACRKSSHSDAAHSHPSLSRRRIEGIAGYNTGPTVSTFLLTRLLLTTCSYDRQTVHSFLFHCASHSSRLFRIASRRRDCDLTQLQTTRITHFLSLSLSLSSSHTHTHTHIRLKDSTHFSLSLLSASLSTTLSLFSDQPVFPLSVGHTPDVHT